MPKRKTFSTVLLSLTAISVLFLIIILKTGSLTAMGAFTLYSIMTLVLVSWLLAGRIR